MSPSKIQTTRAELNLFPTINARSVRRPCDSINVTVGHNENYDGALVKWRNHSISTRETSFGQIRYQPGGYCGPRVQRDYQLVVVHSGHCRVEVDGVERELSIGQVALFRPGGKELFRFSKDGETSHSWCSVRPTSIAAPLRKELDHSPTQAGLSLLFESLLRSTLEYADVGTTLGGQVIDQLGTSLLLEFLRSCETGRRVPYDEPVIKALRYMDEHFEDTDCLARACRVSACSRTALIKKFQRSVGQTPGRHLWQLRTEKGIGMLRNTGLTVSEISEQCGFSNPYHFSRRIRATTGVSPRALREEAWGRPKD